MIVTIREAAPKNLGKEGDGGPGASYPHSAMTAAPAVMMAVPMSR